ncbi:Autophagy-related protein 13 -like protein [Trichinella pseudospiralis]|uniref:Autophagy-related protein 13-like protein n=1 Tax=Trichinella pseudospiralis TaxID=6337 RepID=A0A0V1FDH8_TRIPS|nr:Autophagy-related protein 13 -like protein [Trichinella pseudospiralis]KRY83938.1 Autophagy-related protein 13 -like protein [Trichinella pseudospiralis]
MFYAPTEQDHDDFVQFCQLLSNRVAQVVIQSRLGKKIRTEMLAPSGKNDWFNLNIQEWPEVNEVMSNSLENKYLPELKKLSIVISLKTVDGSSLMLEIWELSYDQNKVDSTVSIRNHLYHRMGVLLRSVICATRQTPVYKHYARNQHPDAFILCYQIRGDSPSKELLGADAKHYHLACLGCPFGTIHLNLYFRMNMVIETADPVFIREATADFQIASPMERLSATSAGDEFYYKKNLKSTPRDVPSYSTESYRTVAEHAMQSVPSADLNQNGICTKESDDDDDDEYKDALLDDADDCLNKNPFPRSAAACNDDTRWPNSEPNCPRTFTPSVMSSSEGNGFSPLPFERSLHSLLQDMQIDHLTDLANGQLTDHDQHRGSGLFGGMPSPPLVAVEDYTLWRQAEQYVNESQQQLVHCLASDSESDDDDADADQCPAFGARHNFAQLDYFYKQCKSAPANLGSFVRCVPRTFVARLHAGGVLQSNYVANSSALNSGDLLSQLTYFDSLKATFDAFVHSLQCDDDDEPDEDELEDDDRKNKASSTRHH